MRVDATVFLLRICWQVAIRNLSDEDTFSLNEKVFFATGSVELNCQPVTRANTQLRC